jgi:hypothetical protein
MISHLHSAALKQKANAGRQRSIKGKRGALPQFIRERSCWRLPQHAGWEFPGSQSRSSKCWVTLPQRNLWPWTSPVNCILIEASCLGARLMQEGELRNVEITLKRKNGQELVCLENTRIVRDGRGASCISKER